MLARGVSPVLQKMSEGWKAFVAVTLVLFTLPLIYLVATPLFSLINDRPHHDILRYVLIVGEPTAFFLVYAYLIRLFNLQVSLLPTMKGRSKIFDLAKIAVMTAISFPGTVVFAGGLTLALRAMFHSETHGISPLEIYQAAGSAGRLSWVNFVLGSVLAPLSEEFMCRGFLAQQLSRVVSIPAAMVISAAVFATLHIPDFDAQVLSSFFLLDFLPMMLIGMILGLLFFRYGLIASICLHSLINSRKLIYQFLDKYPSTHATVSILGAMAIVAMFIIQVKRKNTKTSLVMEFL